MILSLDLPNLDIKGFICFDDLGEFRKDYVKEVLQDEIDHLLQRQYNRLFKIQQIQIELLEDSPQARRLIFDLTRP
jgi:hypothetical protein